MSDIQIYNQDSFLSMKKFESQNLSYSLFKDVDFHNYMHSVSFFRSDFRGSKFEKISFYKNNFDRGDFIDSIFLDCTFEKVNFGCCQIKNCYFENATFKNNSYRNTSLHSTTFVNCVFPDENFLINMQHCKLVNCTFNGCSFEMSTTDSDEFENCYFYDSNLATMHAENHTFINCDFDDIYMDSSYFFSYSISNCNIININFLYRGEYVSFDTINLKELALSFSKENRFNDLINLLKYAKLQSKIPDVISKFIKHCLSYTYGRMLKISNVISTLIFSAMHEEIRFDFLYDSFNLLNDEKWHGFSFSERNEVEALITKFKSALFLTSYSLDYLSTIDQDRYSLLTISFNSDDYNYCLKSAENILSSFSDIKYWQLLDAQHGSWCLTFAIATFILIYILPRIIKNYSDVYYDISTKKSINKALMVKLNKSNTSLKEINNIISQCNNAQLLLESGKCMVDSDIKDLSSITANIQ